MPQTCESTKLFNNEKMQLLVRCFFNHYSLSSEHKVEAIKYSKS